MKAAKRTVKEQIEHGLVANGVGGPWRVEVDETCSGAQQWFAQIEGPSCYLYFEISHPRVLAQVHDFLGGHLAETYQSQTLETELKLADCGGHSVELLWDNGTGDRCFILVRDENDFRMRLTLLREDVQNLVMSLTQVREALSEEGLLVAPV